MFDHPQDRVRALESRKGLNHSLPLLQTWLAEDHLLPAFGRAVQIAGTNGKGSVVRWLECLLKVQGTPSAAFVSPHLLDHAERFRIDGQSVSPADFLDALERQWPAIEKRKMSMFEADLFLACDLFGRLADKEAFLLMEVGLGGAKDATSALHYPFGIITHIGLDHMAYLGDTKDEIAKAKAGIIRPGMMVVCAERDPACLKIFQARAASTGARLLLTPDPAECDSFFSEFWNPQLPAYQKDNFLCAYSLLSAAGCTFSLSQRKEAVRSFFWPARFEILRQNPLVILDGAHNPDGIDALASSIQKRQLHIDEIFFSVLADKQAVRMIETLQSLGASVHLVRFENERFAGLEPLADALNLPLLSFEQMLDRLENSTESTLICGSLYFAAEVLRAFRRTDQTCENRQPDADKHPA